MLENSAAAVVWANSSRWLHERKSAQKTVQANSLTRLHNAKP